MRRVLAILAVAAAFAVASTAPASALDARMVPVGDFTLPVYATGPRTPWEPGLFVVELGGKVKIVRGSTIHTFLDLTPKVSQGGERGLLSMAFAPDYATSGLFYVYYTMVDKPLTTPDETGDIRIEEYRRSANPNLANPASARPLLTIDHSQYSNHNGGQLQIGPEGFLYAGTGDGGGGGDPLGNAQNTSSLLGKLLRINPRGGSPFLVPRGNPYGTPVYGYGLRNPYRFSFDRKTGKLVIADVGQGRREEINAQPYSNPGGFNYGWNRCEGKLTYPPTIPETQCSPLGLNYVGPVLDYPHTGGACSITGGYVVRDWALPPLGGRYLYGDYCTSRLRTVDLANPSTDRQVDTDVTLAGRTLVSFGEDAYACVYVVAISGRVYRLENIDGRPWANRCQGKVR